jgi:hypothetical protein
LTGGAGKLIDFASLCDVVVAAADDMTNVVVVVAAAAAASVDGVLVPTLVHDIRSASPMLCSSSACCST